ncbi:MAG: hypothetical protein IJV86_01280 [Clostridia bacterium]|nr:hypothetical protein [Clostridia bacterium]
MKDFFLKDSVLKIVSFIIALLLWIYIIAVVDPSVDVTVRDIPIRFTNEALIEDKGLCLVSDGTASVELKIRGSRKRIANIDNKNIYATVDLANINKTGTFSLPIAISIPYEYNEIVSKKPYNASVVIDKMVTAAKEVKVITSGSAANGYIAGVPTPSLTSVNLKGASSLLEKIEYVGVQLNFDDRVADIKDTEKLFFIGNDGKRISESHHIYDLVTISEETVDVECPVYRLKTVPVKVDAKTESSVSAYKISVQPTNVTIYAENDVLDNIQEILTKPVMLDQMTEPSVVVGLELPQGVFLRDGIKEVAVKAEKRG